MADPVPFRVPTGPMSPEDRNPVRRPSAAYRAMEDDWRIVRALWGGTRSMRNASVTFMPAEPGEDPNNYANRLARSVLFNGFKRTIKNLAGRPFSKPIGVGEDVPAPIADEWADNIDNAGRDLDNFARDWFQDALQMGISHVLVDFPAAPIVRTKADERAQNIRPFWCHVPADALLGWRSERYGGNERLTQVRILEKIVEDEGAFGERAVEQVRVIYLDHWEIWRPNDKGEWVKLDRLPDDSPATGPMTLGEIPLVTLYTGRTGFMTAEPPLLDLAHLNLQHWRSSSDQENILHVARVPILFGKNLSSNTDTPDGGGMKSDPLVVGPNTLITGQSDSDLKYVEHSGAAISAGRQSLLDIEDRMVTLGLELLVRPQVQTATQKIVDTAESDSELHGMVNNLGAGIEQAFAYMAQWGKLGDKGGTVTINRDYGISARDFQEVQALLQARLNGEITRETFWKELSRRGVLGEDFDSETEAAQLDAEAPKVTGQPLPLGGGQQQPPGNNNPPPGNQPPPSNQPPLPGQQGAGAAAQR